MRLSFLTFLATLSAAAVAQDAAGAAESRTGRLRFVHITTNDVFGDADQPARPLEALVNALHWTTRQEVVAREVWFQRGDVITTAQAAELERSLRALGLFADVTVELVPTGQPDELDLEITTRDRLTLSFGAGGSYVGGVTGIRAAIGEGNLLGYGDRLGASFARNSDGEYRGALTYTDLHVLDSWHTGTLRLGSTEEGDFAGLEVRRPFKHLADPRSYGVATNYEDSDADYYRNGESLAQVHDTRGSLQADLQWGDGPADRRRTAGVVFTLDQHRYGPATGPLGPEIRVPGDTWSAFVGPTATWQWIDGYRKVRGLDTLDYIQDLTLGVNLGLTLGLRWRDEQGASGDLQPEFSGKVGWASELLPEVFTNLGARGGLRWDGGEAVGWNLDLTGRLFAKVCRWDTLAASAAFDAVEEKQDLPLELTLGEDGGLRGYPAREFSGTRRLRTNLENRLDTGLELATLHLGLVAFFDTGWVGRKGDLDRPYSSAGFGLRLGSKHLLGDGVLRIDFAKPLDDLAGENRDWKVSVTMGQVFGFGL